MPSFGHRSTIRLATSDVALQEIFNAVIDHWDCSILEGRRTVEQQRINIENGVSKTMRSKHLFDPSQAVDVAPYPLKWPNIKALKELVEALADNPNTSTADLMSAIGDYVKDVGRYYYFSGYVLGVAQQRGIKIRHGGDWDGDRDIHDQNFDDLVHFELG